MYLPEPLMPWKNKLQQGRFEKRRKLHKALDRVSGHSEIGLWVPVPRDSQADGAKVSPYPTTLGIALRGRRGGWSDLSSMAHVLRVHLPECRAGCN